MLETYSHEQLRELVGHEVHDRDGKKVGYVDLIFVDTDTGKPEWMGVWNGLPRGKRHLAPLVGIRREKDEIILPWTKEQVESAPTYDEEDDRGIFDGEPHFGISGEKEEQALRHYGLERPEGARTDGPRLRVWIYTERAETIIRR
jgi:sporulation protein YlmC with PRC-barrel domain